MPKSAANMSQSDTKKFYQLQERKEVDEIEIEDSYYHPLDGTFTQSSFWVWLNKGFCFEEKGSHCFGEDTLEKIEESLSLVKPCDCEDCR